jgi:type IV pilus biogenesis protein CpaD/CtpE
MTAFLRSDLARLTLAGAVCLGFLAGCGNRDPYQRDDVWYPSGANAANLAAQVADPRDLVRGRNDLKQLADTSSRAIARVRSDSPKPLTPGTSSGSSGGGGGSGSGGGDGGGAGAGGTPTIPSVPSLPGLGGG